MKSFLVIQTAFIGDVVLATAVVEKLHQYFPEANIDFVVRKGNEGLLTNHPFIRKVFIWNKKSQKWKNLWRLSQYLREDTYDYVINLQRFFNAGWLTYRAKGQVKVGFKKNPLSFLFSKAFPHEMGTVQQTHYQHEIDRNQRLIAAITDPVPAMPKLYPSEADYEKVTPLQAQPYICIAPSSVWFTKQFPEDQWAQLIAQLPPQYTIYLLGGPNDQALCHRLANQSESVISLAGQLNFLQSVALMQSATMNYVNDSAPLHFCSAVNAPVTAIFCSTIPAFGFTPLSDVKALIETPKPLSCRPCGIHGYKACPKGHFQCAKNIQTKQLLWWTTLK